MIRRLLLVLLAAIAVMRLVRRSARRDDGRGDARPLAARFEGSMVRDRVCQTFLPRSSALTVSLAGREHYFCSETCRARFLARHHLIS